METSRRSFFGILAGGATAATAAPTKTSTHVENYMIVSEDAIIDRMFERLPEAVRLNSDGLRTKLRMSLFDTWPKNDGAAFKKALDG